jgi:uncharacterized cupredoxin-like copper-binding protein
MLSACTPRASQTVTTIQATLADDSIRPALARVPAGQTITLRLTNAGNTPHAWVLLKDLPTDPFDADDAANILAQFTLEPGETRSAEFRSPAAPGEYSVSSSLPGDLEKGLTAKLLVVQPGY